MPGQALLDTGPHVSNETLAIILRFIGYVNLYFGSGVSRFLSMKPETLGQLVTRRMKEQGLRAPDVERLSGKRITDSTVNEIASGKQSNPTINKLTALAEVLSISPHELLSAAIGERMNEAADQWPVRTLWNAVGRIIDDPTFSKTVKTLLSMNEKQLQAAERALVKIRRER